jgi:hypothetical protein
MMRYSEDDTINAVVSAMVDFFDVNPWNFGEEHADKTIAEMREGLRQLFGRFARGVRMPTIH